MLNTRSTHFLWALICVLALVIGLIAGRMGFVGQTPNSLSVANFRADFPLSQIRAKTFRNEIVQIDGNEFIDCTFDNATLKFEGTAPFRFTNDHFNGKINLTSNNPSIRATIELMGALITAERPAQNQSKDNK